MVSEGIRRMDFHQLSCEQRKEQSEKMRAAATDCFLRHYAKFGDLEMAVNQYLLMIDELPWDNDIKLTALISGVQGVAEWKVVCLLYDYILRLELKNDQSMTYINWLTDASNALKHFPYTPPERLAIVNDALSIGKRALLEYSEDAVFALLVGNILLQSPDFTEFGKNNYALASDWFVRALMWNHDDADEAILAQAEVGLLECFYRQKNWSQVVELYGRINLENIGEVDGDEKLKELEVWFNESLKN